MRNIKVSSRVSDIRALCGLISSPLWENTLSTGADVAGVHSSRLKFTVHQKTTRIQSFMRWKCFNIVAVLVSQNTSLARPRTWLVKAKDFCSRPRPWPSRPRPRTYPQGQGQGQGQGLKICFRGHSKAKDNNTAIKTTCASWQLARRK